MKNVPTIPVLLFAIFVILAAWANVHIYEQRQDRLREIWNRRCVCNAQTVDTSDSTNMIYTPVRQLPSNAFIERSAQGTYRWVEGFWKSMREHPTAEAAEADYWEITQRQQRDSTNWTRITP